MERMERNEEIIVLDAGNDGETLTPEIFCCAMAFTFFIG